MVRAIVEAALDALGEHGYAAMAMEEVAARAGVNKTTVYRRFPTKADLVFAVFERIAWHDYGALEQSGDLRKDLRSAVLKMNEFVTVGRGRALIRTITSERISSELGQVVRKLRRHPDNPIRRLLEGAKLRGDLRADADLSLVMDMLFGCLHQRAFVLEEPVSGEALDALIEQLLVGVVPSRTRAAAQRGRGRRTAARKRVS